MTEKSTQPDHFTVANLRVIPYDNSYHARVVALFKSGVASVREGGSVEMKADLDGLETYAVKLFDDVDALVRTDNGGRFFLAVTTEDIVAGMFGIKREDKDVEEGSAEIIRVCVDCEWRRRGVCSMLMEWASRYAMEELGLKRIYLHSMASIPSGLAVYRKIGFKEKLMECGYDGVQTRIMLFWMDLPENQTKKMRN